MTTYQLTITRFVENTAYKPHEEKDYGYSNDKRNANERNPFIETALSVSLSEEQFEVIKKAALENWS